MLKRSYKVTPHTKSAEELGQTASEFNQQSNKAFFGDTVASGEGKLQTDVKKRSHKKDEADLNDAKSVIHNKTDADSAVDLKEAEPDIAVYRRRWYILAVYSLVTFTQAALWNTWGPIAVSCQKVFGWNDTILALLPNWGPIGFLLSEWMFSWSMDVHGIRLCCVVTAAMTAVASAIRCITSEPPYITWTANISAFLNGLGGPVAMGVPPVLSAAWFPPNQRTTSTAIATLFNYAGVAAAFLIGPLFENNDKANTTYTGSLLQNESVSMTTNSSLMYNQEEAADIDRIRNKIMVVMYAECGWCIMVLILILAYFPSKPPMPPSKTASQERLDMKSGFKKLMRNKMFLQLCFAYGIPVGIVGLWGGVLTVNLKSYDVSEAQAGWIGFNSIVAGCLGSLLIARISDRFSKHIRQMIIFLYSLAFASFLWLNLTLVGVIPSSIAQIYISIVAGTFFVNACVPLLIEMACENTYPVAEGITTIMMLTSLNVSGLLFLGVQMIPNIGTAWENWGVLTSIVVCIPVLILMNDSYNRLNIDETVSDKTIELTLKN
ncbi:disrupted in renal carcinoma protein 2 homolog [Mizuhopecten yessoensis]|uniref:Disrupted in renal carcinoma protein 2-like n=1 Tax=Mizuhopecten yessoensis TaxID=6573 RepID=A0A210Q528_MIZYE|nr:disrupted in renal carcinoma protein 2 homolog [Mizuhopecten yessoensis]OWF43789.1 Disrupted in renal carcinoma protein 2-like [Mizuhopecten yessoensis]